MAIERQLRDRTQGLDNNRPNGNVWDEVAVHNVHMQPFCTAIFSNAHALLQPGEICREQRGSNDYFTSSTVAVGPCRMIHGKSDWSRQEENSRPRKINARAK